MKKARIVVGLGALILSAVLVAGLGRSRILPLGPEGAENNVVGRNVNTVSGTKLPWGDPWLQRQNEPSGAVSSRNSMHLFFGANDYRTIDMPDLANQQVPGIPIQIAAARDAWLGAFKSLDGGQSWITTLLPGFPQDNSAAGLASPIHGFDAACDPCVRAGANGMFFYSGIAFNRSGRAGAVFVARYIDNNNLEKVMRDNARRPVKDPIQYLDTRIIGTGNPGQFLDMPSIAVDIPRPGLGMSVINGQNLPNANVYIAYTLFPGSTATDVRSKLYFSRSTNSGRTWSAPIKLSESQQIVQRAVIAIDPRDASGKTIYVAFRRFKLDLNPDAMVIVKSFDGGKSFTKPVVIASLAAPFDQLMSADRFRTNSHPALAVDPSGAVYVAWAERRNRLTGAADPQGQARIVVATSPNGLIWNAPQPVELMGEMGSALDGHQVMPALISAGGRLLVAWYDQRNSLAKETRPDSITEYLEDVPGIYRHTVDVRAAEWRPGQTPWFGRSWQVSRYLFYLTLAPNEDPPENADYPVRQAEFNMVNLPLFQQGTRPFPGDFMDVAASPFILPPPVMGGGSWGFNTLPAEPTIFHAVWTDNRDVRPPDGDIWGDWVNYSPPNSTQDAWGLGQSNSCTNGGRDAGKRNQNVYTASLSRGLIVGSPGNTKQLDIEGGSGIPGGRRTFVVLVRNLLESEKTFELTFDEAVPQHAAASFDQAGDQNSRKVTVGPFSSAALTVYVDESSNPLAPVKVDVREAGSAGPPDGYVLLNPDATNLYVADPGTGSSNLGNEDHTPAVSNPKVWKYKFGDASEPNAGFVNPRVQNKQVLNSGYVNPRVQNQDLENPRVQNKSETNQNLINYEAGNPRVQNPRVQNTALTDMTWTVTNDGNTTSTYSFDVVASTAEQLRQYFESGQLIGQVLVYKIHTTPLDEGCELKEEHHDELVVNVTNPRVQNPRVQNIAPANAAVMPQGAGSVSGLASVPDIGADDATFCLAPDEQAFIIFRVYDIDTTDGVDFNPQTVAAEVVTAAVNTGATEPVVAHQEDVPWETPLPAIGFQPTDWTYNTSIGPNPADRVLTIWNAGSGTLQYTVTDDVPWLSVSPASWTSLSQSDEKNHLVSVDLAGLSPGEYHGTIIIDDPYAVNNPVRIPVTLVLVQAPPAPAAIRLTGPARAGCGFLSEAFTLTVVDGSGNPVNVTTDTTFALSSDSDGPHAFYADPSMKSRTTQATVLAGANSATFYYQDSVPKGERSVTASWTGGGSDLGSSMAWIQTWVVVGQIAYSSFLGPASGIYVVQTDGTPPMQLTSNLAGDEFAAWSPGGGRIAFSRHAQAGDGTMSAELCVANADGSWIHALTNNGLMNGQADWSPDGSRITFSRGAQFSVSDKTSEIFVMNADGTGVTQLTANEAYDGDPCWSPGAGSKIVFVSDRRSPGFPELYIMNTDGSNQAPLLPTAMYSFHPAWSPDGSRIAFAGATGGYADIYVVNDDGSNLTALTGPNDAYADNAPAWSPDGSRIAFMTDRGGAGTIWDIFIMNSDGTNLTSLASTAATEIYPAWGGGKIAFESGGAVWLVNPDGSGLTRVSADGVAPRWSADGNRIAFERVVGSNREVFIMRADGTWPVNVTNNPADDFDACWSPDGTQIAFVSGRDGNLEIYKMDTAGTNVIRLTDSPNGQTSPDWSPDGTRILYCDLSADSAQIHIFIMNADGTNKSDLTRNIAQNVDPCWSPDGSYIIFASNAYGDNFEIYYTIFGGIGIWEGVAFDSGTDRHPCWSPSASGFAWQSNRSGIYEVYIQRGLVYMSPVRLTDMNADSIRPSWRLR